jgi:hypothetical protein
MVDFHCHFFQEHEYLSNLVAFVIVSFSPLETKGRLHEVNIVSRFVVPIMLRFRYSLVETAWTAKVEINCWSEKPQ